MEGLSLTLTITLNHISSGIQFVYVVTDYSTNFTVINYRV